MCCIVMLWRLTVGDWSRRWGWVGVQTAQNIPLCGCGGVPWLVWGNGLGLGWGWWGEGGGEVGLGEDMEVRFG